MLNARNLSILALILFLIGLAGSIFTFSTLHRPTAVSEEKSFDHPNITAIDINTSNASVEVIPVKNETAKVKLSGFQSPSTHYSFSADLEGTTLSIELKETQTSWINLFPTTLTLKVFLPEKQYESMDINNDNGSIHIKDLHAKTVHAETDNGKISLRHVTAKMTGKTVNGDISLETDSLDRPLQFETDNGSIMIETEQEPTNAKLDVKVDNGSIDLLGQYKESTVIGKGENLIKLTTINGDILVTK